MDLTRSESNYHSSKYFLNKYFVYILLVVLVIVNVLFFPDLLNHKDMKLNDMSYMLPQVEASSKGEVEVKAHEEKKVTAELNNSTEYPTLSVSPAETPSEKTDNAEVVTKGDVDRTNPSVGVEAKALNSTASDIVTPKVEETISSNVKSDVNSTSVDGPSPVTTNLTVLEDAKFMADNSHDKTDGIKINPANVNSESNVEKDNKDNKNIQVVTTPQTSEHKSSSGYLLLLFLVVSALFISIGMYIYNSQDKLKMVFFANKNPLFREYIYSGYELLQD